MEGQHANNVPYFMPMYDKDARLRQACLLLFLTFISKFRDLRIFSVEAAA